MALPIMVPRSGGTNIKPSITIIVLVFVRGSSKSLPRPWVWPGRRVGTGTSQDRGRQAD